VHFWSTRVDVLGDGSLHVFGKLEVAGIVEPVELAAIVQPVGAKFAVEATTTVDPRRFGMSSGVLGMIRGPATLHVRALLNDAAPPRTKGSGAVPIYLSSTGGSSSGSAS
jgi:hypothetical protein